MDYFRRPHHSSYPPRPSPLGSSHESRDDQPRALRTSADDESRNRPEYDKPRLDRYDYTASSAHLYSPGASHVSHLLRHESAGAQPSPSRSYPSHQHRRHASLETRHHPHAHRRNNSQPQAGHHREARRASQGSSGSPVQTGTQDQSAPPASGSRQMPPPSPPHSYGSRSLSANAPTASLLSRDGPGNPSYRPGSSMSISAMLGSDAERPAPARDHSISLFSRPSGSSLYGNAPTSAAAMSPPTAPARPSPLDQSLFRRSHTPENAFSTPQLGRPYPSGSGGGSGLLGPEQSKFGGLPRAPHSQYPEKPHSTHPSPQMPPAEPPYHEPRRMSFSGPIARPNSQPPNAEMPTRSSGYSPLSRPTGGPGELYEPGHRSSSTFAGLDPHGRDPHARFGSLFGDRRSEETVPRDRDRAAHSDAKGALGATSRYASLFGDREPLDRHANASAWEQGRSHPSSPESKRFPAPESRFGFGAIQSYTKSLGSQPGGSRQPPLSLQTGHGATPGTAAPTGSALLGLAAAGDEGRRKGSDELLQHRNLLAVGADGKRGGRASPLPQAVQGAQAPFINPSGEPGIKNELGRVFSGIGSGVGGVTAGSSGSGPSTPLISSPFKRNSLTGRSVNGEADDNRISRPTSATGARRSRKSRDEDMELEAGGFSARGSRRTRHVHHHHQHHHHHPAHYHHRHKEEDAAALSLLRQTSLGRTSTPAEASLGHHHHHHHHHHAPRPATIAPASPVREPRTTVNLEPLLSSVAHLPRHHLGSTLYTPRISIPSAKASTESAKFGYTTTPQPLPRFERRENCTFTVRVPRFRIDATHREEICARRALWGTGVYTDDSDPVAAAIHSGFIRGAWGEDVDESMLDLEIKDTYQHAPQSTTEERREDASKDDSQANEPRLPPIPPSDQDLHITLLILPRLERYEPTVMFGVKSRKWDGRHDGMSFKIHRVDWVDDGVGRGEERSGEARRKRLRTLMQTGRICTGPAMAKMDELRRSGVQVPRTLDDQPTPVQLVS
ncbi:uncharacterized protein N7459_008871 [Penicillium hispanicum]|uniref:uncharacterized protein n=1 Tax=Penicillium hispanicum TaxID=1080232 RepID=UPI0025409319|nr:uncharacterized protein N7459_008871 [Penicillium hispanicum]KAJ5569441.1 hypothetical protein N7459_008871 [Penicillium hispanicum]